MDQNGRNFIADVGPGDLWYFPPGIPHSIQGLAEGCEFLLVFDDGGFSDLNTLSISDWFAHTPREVLSANFGIPETAFAYLPKEQVYIYQDQVPGPIASQRIESPYGEIPLSFKHRLMAQPPLKTPGGSVRIVDSSNFPVSRNIAAALVEIEPGAMRELHWHPNNDEWQYYLSGQGRMTVFGGNGDARTFNVRAGDVGYVPFAQGHYVQNTGTETLWFLEMFKSDRFADVSLNQWMALTPHEAGQQQSACRAGADERPAQGEMACGEVPGAAGAAAGKGAWEAERVALLHFSQAQSPRDTPTTKSGQTHRLHRFFLYQISSISHNSHST